MSELVPYLVRSPVFGIGISIITFYAGNLLYKKTGSLLLNPLVLSMLMIIGLLLSLHITFDDYNRGGQYISFFLGPATVILAVPLYKKISLLRLMPAEAGILNLNYQMTRYTSGYNVKIVGIYLTHLIDKR